MRMLDKQSWQASLGARASRRNHNTFEIRYSILWDNPDLVPIHS